MRRWETKILRFTQPSGRPIDEADREFTELLNEHGAQGWEPWWLGAYVVSGTEHVQVRFKREIVLQ